jgi:Flp pilus assembly protein TadG
MPQRRRVSLRPSSARLRVDRGAAAVELALVLPLLVSLVLGMVTGGLSYSNAIGVQDAVREGARFGATADASSVTWASDVITQVRATQFDDGTTAALSGTSVCVQLFKTPGTVSRSLCSVGGRSGPALSISSSGTDAPAVPPTLPAGACVVRVVAARRFTVNIAVTRWSGTLTRSATAAYERTCP